MLDYTYRDFVRTWYQRLSDDDQFHHDVTKALQRVIIAFSERFVCMPFVSCILSLYSNFDINKSSQSAHTSARENLVPMRSLYPECRYRSGLWIRTSDPDDFQNLTGTSLFQVTFVVKFSGRSDHFVQRYEPNCGKMPSSIAMLKNPEEILDPDPEADDFQNLISSSLSTDINIDGKISTKISSAVSTLSC